RPGGGRGRTSAWPRRRAAACGRRSRAAGLAERTTWRTRAPPRRLWRDAECTSGRPRGDVLRRPRVRHRANLGVLGFRQPAGLGGKDPGLAGRPVGTTRPANRAVVTV